MALRKKQKKSKPAPRQQEGRYTPPLPKEYKVSPRWVPILMFLLFGLGTLVIILNYMPGAPLLPGDTSNWKIVIGLGLITGGFAVSTQYH